MKQNQPSIVRETSRRDFLKTSAVLAGGAAIAPLAVERSAHAAGSDIIKVGLIGCGDRGRGAAKNAMNAGKDIRLVAMGDIFDERLKYSLNRLKDQRPEQMAVKDSQCFIGFDAYKKVLASDIDVVIVAPSSHFNPEVFKAAVEAGKHIFVEKPHGIDIPGIKICMAAAEEAKKKKLNVVSGLCWRYHPAVRETMKRVHDGMIGDIVAIQENYVTVPYYVRERQPGHTEMEHQLWNWYHFNWLSGDQTSQQLIHCLDKASWALGDKPPKKAWGMGGRQTCTTPAFGDQFDHQAVIFEYDKGVRVFGYTRDQQECHTDVSDYIMGTKGRCNLLAHTIEGEKNWVYQGPYADPKDTAIMYDVEHKELFDAVRNGTSINNGHYMCLSSALAVVAQMACYSGNMIGWEQAMRSERSFALPRYGFDVEPPVKPNPDGTYASPAQGKAELSKWI